jgi:hypothetical protein
MNHCDSSRANALIRVIKEETGYWTEGELNQTFPARLSADGRAEVYGDYKHQYYAMPGTFEVVAKAKRGDT